MASHLFSDPNDPRTDEPSLDELFAEPIIQLVMQRDGVKAQEMRLEFDRLMAACPA